MMKSIKIKTSVQLQNAIDTGLLDSSAQKIAILFIAAMNDWPSINQIEIKRFIAEFKDFYGTISIDNIKSKKIDLSIDHNAWRMESGNSIIELIELAEKEWGQDNFETIIAKVLH